MNLRLAVEGDDPGSYHIVVAFDQIEDGVRNIRFHINDIVADRTVGLVLVGIDVDLVVAKHVGDKGDHAGHIPVDHYQPGPHQIGRNHFDVGEIDAVGNVPVTQVI